MAIALLGGCGGAPPEGRADPAGVVATIPPIGDWCRVLLPPETAITVVLQPGQSPHGFEPTAAAARRIAGATVVIGWGGPVDRWLDAFLAGGAQEPTVVWLAGEAGATGMETVQPHAWLAPTAARQAVTRLAEALAEAFPADARAITQRAAAYDEQLYGLQQRMRRAARGWEGLGVVSLHDAWQPFFNACGLAHLGSIQSVSGAPPSSARLVHLAETLTSQPYRVLAVEPQLSGAVANLLAREAAAQVVVLDPLGRADVPGYDSYLAMMQSNLDALAAILPPIPSP